MKAHKITGRRNERGIAVIVVVGIMVALIMVTTALLGLVNRTTKVSAAIFQNDLAKIAALSGKAKAIAIVEDITNTDSVKSWADKLVYTSDPSEGIETYALGLVRSIRTAVDGAVYFPGEIVVPSKNLINQNNALAKKYAIVPDDIDGDGNTDDDIDGNTMIFKSDMFTETDMSALYKFSGYELVGSVKYHKSFPGGYFDKDLLPADLGSATDDTNKLAASFYASRYFIYIQDLNGCLNVGSDTKLDLTQAKNIIDKATGATISLGTDKLYSFSDIVRKLGNKNRRYAEMLTPWGNTAATTYEFKYKTAAPALGEAILADLRQKITDNGGDATAVSTIFDDATNGVVALYKECRNDGSKVFKTKVETGLTTLLAAETNATKKKNLEKVANAIRENLLGIGTVNDDGADGAETLTLPGSYKRIDFVDDITSANERYYRVIVRGELVNLAKSEILSESNLEMVYEKDTNKIVYQRWFENE